MKKLTRLSLILFVLGISLLAVTLARGNTSFRFTRIWMQGLGNPEWDVGFEPFFAPPRTLRMQVNLSSPVDIYVLRGDELRLWSRGGALKALQAFYGVEKGIFTLQLPERGEYTLLVHGPSNSSYAGKIDLTLYGIESDLLSASISLSVVSVVLFFGIQISSWRKRQNKTLTAINAEP